MSQPFGSVPGTLHEHLPSLFVFCLCHVHSPLLLICHQNFHDLSQFDDQAKMQLQHGLAGAAARSNFCSFYRTFLSSVLRFFLFPDPASLTLPFPPRLRDQCNSSPHSKKIFLSQVSLAVVVRVKNAAVLVCGLNGCDAQPTTLTHTHTHHTN